MDEVFINQIKNFKNLPINDKLFFNERFNSSENRKLKKFISILHNNESIKKLYNDSKIIEDAISLTRSTEKIDALNNFFFQKDTNTSYDALLESFNIIDGIYYFIPSALGKLRNHLIKYFLQPVTISLYHILNFLINARFTNNIENILKILCLIDLFNEISPNLIPLYSIYIEIINHILKSSLNNQRKTELLKQFLKGLSVHVKKLRLFHKNNETFVSLMYEDLTILFSSTRTEMTDDQFNQVNNFLKNNFLSK